ncbi:hypothetical protein Salat_1418000 [Sesamum alatum]|uniref:Uncharacterized protein n=1 Tax=Sesamum alatum TaxID=300844 RepID=A0AAE1YAK4_9LAMI|nr:hypothetical protein Salat_1418000 [Sesamum alatum]
MTFSHDLSLKCSMFCHQKSIAESKILELHKDVLEAQQKEKTTLDDKSALETQIAELKSSLQQATEATKKSVAKALEQGKTEGFSAGRVVGRTEGINEGCEAFLHSDEYKKQVTEHRLQGAKDFLKAPAFKMAVEIQSARSLTKGSTSAPPKWSISKVSWTGSIAAFLIAPWTSLLKEGFDKCASQVEHLKGFVDGFDRSLLDRSLDVNLQPYVDDAATEIEEEDEFEALVSKVWQRRHPFRSAGVFDRSRRCRFDFAELDPGFADLKVWGFGIQVL